MKRNVRKGKTMSKAENYIRDYTKRCSNAIEAIGDDKTVAIDYAPWLTPDNALAAVEIERQEVIENLWHDASEEPNGKEYVIAWDGKYASIARYKSIVNCKWCYLSDILPNKEKGV